MPIGSGFGTTVDAANAKTATLYADGTEMFVETGSDEFDEDVSMTKAGGVSLTLQTTATAIVDGDSWEGYNSKLQMNLMEILKIL